ncbi:MAG: RNA signal recognition particle [Candidatus Staskawiczbacteria bacterium RIFCSPHIGHO2_02_FULL_43_16]|uniref:RNA signal recognition particle n=1 Tax=Candidatus Staskawiczbacteria bacterium RIFCSPHIGHO2_01_FULL_41_41 TaxID=1802203 RepID=A0A1G2HT40_9BACT|nr:MAG: RNA signal recognition particle [Candidatus Staskawiczbacteria bacterium RIFCSPHIGHO2_01_FULL_41_41]OGZ68220.1 MAG: RNA signal recognition particle [Candidatus Staskawiczbacteria bacterium RIFCSPHIGHO2_02_FULL_43_16]OGZ75009.1 MAG: RNA signal recognition particle [Candidatus Staskawiczbacteria bacterium RIFCSPLOWO2_01_FULL_43_17b]
MAKGTYVDGFVIPIPKKNTAKYKKMAQEGAKIWKQFGALEYKECILDDPNQPHVKFTFPKMAKAKSGETVWFSFIVFKSRQHRDAVNKKVMAYFEKKYSKEAMKDMPFDMKRMAYAGFKVIVNA